VASARKILQRLSNVPVNWFCYPSGHYDQTVIAAAKAAGFVGATTVIPGRAALADDPFTLPRLRVLGRTSPALLLSQIDSARGDSPALASYG
jgi:peptidoglycan/xylan/chitin deacetylase (PgdA/CDA1 family)